MELKEYLQIIKSHKKIFLVTWGIIFGAALFVVFVQPIVYEGEQTALLIRGDGNKEESSLEKYDYFYRLESDKKMAEVMIKFLEDKYLLQSSFDRNIFSEKEDVKKIAISESEKKWMITHINGSVLSSGYFKIVISGHNQELTRQVGGRVFQQLQSKMSKIGNNKNRLIKLDISPMVVTQKNRGYLPVGLGAFFGGLLIAIFMVLGLYYWQEE